MSKKRFTPPRWLNALMGIMLRTPGLQRLVGRSTALLTFTGRRSGRAFTTPVSYSRRDSGVIVTAHETRQWWRNFATQPRVAVRLAGTGHTGTARLLSGEERRTALVGYLADQPMLAKKAGVTVGATGEVDPEQADTALADTVVVAIDLDEAVTPVRGA